MKQTKKTILEVNPATHERVRKQANKAQRSTKEITSVLLAYALEKLESGAISIGGPFITEEGAA